VTELAVSTVAMNSTKMGEGSSSGARLPEDEERTVSVVTSQETKTADDTAVTYPDNAEGDDQGNESKVHILEQFC
jgi:hypothetical protein